jgi:hypothetical protein
MVTETGNGHNLPFTERGNLPLERLHCSGKPTDELRAQFGLCWRLTPSPTIHRKPVFAQTRPRPCARTFHFVSPLNAATMKEPSTHPANL